MDYKEPDDWSDPYAVVGHRSIESEQVVLGAILVDPEEVMPICLSILQVDDFYSTTHQNIFWMASQMFNSGKPIDIVTMSEALKDLGKLDVSGGRTYINELAMAASLTGSLTISFLAKRIRNLKTRRDLQTAALNIIQISNETTDAAEAVASAQDCLIEVAQREVSDSSFTSVGEVADEIIGEMLERANNPRNVTGTPSGFDDIDALTQGWQKSDLIIIAARPSMGKTAFMMNAVENCVVKEKKPALIFSLEMSRTQLIERLVSSLSEVPSQRIKTGFLSSEDVQKIYKAHEMMLDMPLYIDDTAVLTPTKMQIVSKQVSMKTGSELGLIALDYLQLMDSGTSNRNESENTRVSQISKALKQLAKELDVPVMALSQLSRAVEARPDKRPILSDLRDSGSIEQDADIVAFLYRDEYYTRDKTEAPGIAEVIFAKHRKGEVGAVKLLWRHSITRFLSVPRMPRGMGLPNE